MKIKKIEVLIIFFSVILVCKKTYAGETVNVANEEVFTNEALVRVEPNYSTYNMASSSWPSCISKESTILDKNNNLNFIYYDDNYVYIQKLDSNNKNKKTLKIEKRYSVYGNTIIDKNGNYYIAWGNNDYGEANVENDVIAFAISKYDSEGNYIATFEETNYHHSGSVRIIFDLGRCEMAINDNGILAYDYVNEMKNGHQANATGYVDTATMKKCSYINTHPYTSHCFGSRLITVNGGDFLFTDHGDAAYRGFSYTLISNKLLYSNGGYYNANRKVFHFREGADMPSAYTHTFASLGNVIELNDGIALIGASEKTLSLDPSPDIAQNESRNAFVQIYKKSAFYDRQNDSTPKANDFITYGTRNSIGTEHTTDGNKKFFNKTGTTDYGVKWLTNYSDEYSVNTINAVKVDNQRIAVFWEQYNYNTAITGMNTAYYMVIDKNGNIVQDKTLIELGHIPLMDPPVYKDGYIYFTNSNYGTTLTTYKIKLYDYVTKKDVVYPISISLNKENIKDIVGTKEQLDVEYNPTNTTEKNIKWKSSNTGIATVSDSGLVTLVGDGECTITATLPNGKSATCTVMSLNKDASIVFKKSFYIVRETQTLNLKSNLEEVNGKEIDYSKITYKLSDPNVGTIDSNGKLTFNTGYQDTLIEATATYIGKTTSTKIRILSQRASTASFALKKLTSTRLYKGDSARVCLYQPKLNYSVYVNKFEVDINYNPENLSLEKIEPLIENLTAQETEKGKIHVTYNAGNDCINLGRVEFLNLTFKSIVDLETENKIYGSDWYHNSYSPDTKYTNYNNLSYSTYIYTKSKQINKIFLDIGSMVLDIGGSRTVKATISPSDTTSDKILTWTSSDEKVAIVDQTGKVTGVGAGTATITATSVNGVSNSCNVTVQEGKRFLKGDINNDGKVNIFDVNYGLQKLSKKNLTEDEIKRGDVTGDGKYTILDVNKILRYLSGKIKEL